MSTIEVDIYYILTTASPGHPHRALGHRHGSSDNRFRWDKGDISDYNLQPIGKITVRHLMSGLCHGIVGSLVIE